MVFGWCGAGMGQNAPSTKPFVGYRVTQNAKQIPIISKIIISYPPDPIISTGHLRRVWCVRYYRAAQTGQKWIQFLGKWSPTQAVSSLVSMSPDLPLIVKSHKPLLLTETTHRLPDSWLQGQYCAHLYVSLADSHIVYPFGCICILISLAPPQLLYMGCRYSPHIGPVSP